MFVKSLMFYFIYAPALLLLVSASGQNPAAAKGAPRPGVKTPGVRVPIAALEPEHQYEVPGSPDWISVGDSVWISNSPKNSVTRIDPKTNTVAAVIETGKAPC